MSTKTTNYNLHKIDLTDAPPDITVLNQNWDILDEKLKDMEESGATLPVKTATIGTTWTEDEETGVKSQRVSISEITADMTAKVDTAYTGDGTSESYETFVTAQNEFLTYITNGYAKTIDGGITFYIFGDANTVEIPIVVEVS